MLNRQEQSGTRTSKPGEGEFSIFWPCEGEGEGNNDKGAEDNSIEEEKNQKELRGLQWDKPPRKDTWNWSHPGSHALVATRVDPHKLSNSCSLAKSAARDLKDA
ncbi:hypothetical protein K438DRAFT_1778890 [Mycena galopus ATCC 62051]|nr:hypothetical protein K438DRAFT_1778890 [Mycena galopus ATCC 62051]